MSVALFVVAERKVKGLDTEVNGKALGRCEHLDRLARAAGVREFMEFFSEDPTEASATAEEFGLETPPGGFPAEQWFPAEAGLVTVRGLLGHLAANPSAVSDAERIAEDLREFESVLAALSAAGVRWHLAVDY